MLSVFCFFFINESYLFSDIESKTLNYSYIRAQHIIVIPALFAAWQNGDRAEPGNTTVWPYEVFHMLYCRNLVVSEASPVFTTTASFRSLGCKGNEV